MIGGLASLFMAAICWCMETTAVTVGWWRWTLPTRTALFGNVNVPAMEGWFSVVPDFLIPFLVIVCSATRHARLKWLWLLAFPLHLFGHLTNRWFQYGYLTYPAMELGVVALMMFHPLRMARGEIGDATLLDLGTLPYCAQHPSGRKGNRVASPIFLAAALAIFFGVVTLANLSVGGPAEALTALPMLMLCLLAWRRLPAWAVAGLSLVALTGWAWMGPRALWALTPIAAWGFLALIERTEIRDATLLPYGPKGAAHNRVASPISVWLRAVPIVVLLALLAATVVLEQADRGRVERYKRFWAEGDRLEKAERIDEARQAYARADEARPRDIVFLYLSIGDMARPETTGALEAAQTFRRRLPRLVREMTEVVRRDPGWATPRRELAAMVSALAIHGEHYTDVERVRLLNEAARLDGNLLQPQLALAQVYLKGPPRDLDRALRHARRALALARDAGDPEDLADAFLVLGETLVAVDRKDEARRALEEGRTKAPPGMFPEFDGLLQTLPAPVRNEKGRSD